MENEESKATEAASALNEGLGAAGYLKVFMLIMAILGLSILISRDDPTKTWIAFACIAALVLHLEWKIEANRVVINVNGKRITWNGREVDW